MAHPPEVKAAVRAAYIYQRLPLNVAAEQNGVSDAAARTWKRVAEAEGDDWDAARAAASLSREGQMAVATAVLEEFVIFFRATIEALRGRSDLDPLEVASTLSRLADSYAKMVGTAGKVSTPINRLSVALETLRELARYIQRERPDALPQFADLLEAFGSHLTEVMSRG